jgi:hypothetical protein
MTTRQATNGVAATAAEVHVAPIGRTAKWRVHDGDPSDAASEHKSVTDAEAAACRRAITRGADRVVIHDRYHRTRLIDVEAHRPTVAQMGERSFPRALASVYESANFGKPGAADR